ncbi:MAG: DUF2339 domain-containing protein [Planctomycetota bacterium]
MSGFLVLLGLFWLVAPPIALGLAIAAYNNSKRLTVEVEQLRRRLRKLNKSASESAAAVAPLTADTPIADTHETDAPGVEAAQDPVVAAKAPAETIAPTATPSTADKPANQPDAEGAAVTPAAAILAPVAPARTKPARAPLSLEELLSTKVIVWIAAVAVALAGAFLVRYFVQQGLLTEPMKVGLATLLGSAMVAAGETVRRRGMAVLASGLVAAGAPCLYAAILGLVHYDLAPPGVGLILVAVCTAFVIVLSLRHGPLVATLGLVGGFLMPALIRGHSQPPMQLFGYLLLLQVGLIALARWQRWWWLSLPALLAGLLWAGCWIAFSADLSDRHWVSLFLLASTGAFVLGSWHEDPAAAPNTRRWLPWLAVAPAIFLSATLARAGNFTNFDWSQLAFISAASIVLARLRPQYLAMPWFAVATVAMLLIHWAETASGSHGLSVLFGSASIPSLLAARWGTISMLFGMLFVFGSCAVLWGSGQERWWSRLSGVTATGFLTLTYSVLAPTTLLIPWWSWAVGGALVFGALAAVVHRRHGEDERHRVLLGNLCVTATALSALAVWFVVGQADDAHRSWITIAWALELPVVAWLAARLRVRELTWATVALAGLIITRLAAAPLLQSPVGTGLIFNWILWGYGIPVVGFALAAYALRAWKEQLCSYLQAGAIAIAFSMLTLLVRNGFDGVRASGDAITLYEFGSYAAVWGGLSLVLAWISTRVSSVTLTKAWIATLIASLTASLLGAGLGDNPLAKPYSIGHTQIFNGLLFLYGLPAVLAFVSARLLHWREQSRDLVGTIGIAGLALTFGLVTLQVRHLFVGHVLAGPSPSDAEGYAYSAAWILFAGVLLALALTIRTPIKAQIRWASLSVMLAAVAKVFLYDMRELQDIWRVVSFLGLGLSLFGVAWVYQRFVFTTQEALPPAPPHGAT